MTNVARLKEQARALELKEQWREALELYTRLAEESTPDGLDIGLWNRIGDLHLRVGQAERAVGAYWRAVDAYAEAGFTNNAIALCNKILRTDAENTEVYLRLGKLSAEQGFLVDARANILRYAERANREGRVEAAFEALAEFAALAPNDVEIRLLLADQLEAHGRPAEALEQLSSAFGALAAAGRPELEAELRERILALAPDADLDALKGESPSDERPDEQAEASEEEELPSLPTLALGESEDIGIVPTAQVSEPIEAGLELEEISHLEGLEPTHAAEPAQPGTERLAEEPELAEIDAEESDAPLPLLDERLDPLEPGAIVLPEPDVEPIELAVSEPEPDPLPTLPTWGDLDIEPAPPTAEPPTPAPREPEPESQAVPAPPAPPPAPPREEYVDLAALVFEPEDEPEPTTRFVVAEEEPSGDEDRDFAEMLARFRQKVDENIATDDSDSHYDLGLAFKDMGLLDEAIAQFQVALRGGANPLATIEVLGECFVEKQQYALASRVLERAFGLPGASEGALLGVYYLYARAEEALGNRERAIEYYERVLSADIRFRDARPRLAALQRSTPPGSF